MKYRSGRSQDIPGVARLQQRYHVKTIKEADRADGFVTTLFTESQFQELIANENGLAVALDGEKVVGYAMAASWQYWSVWPLFQHMIDDLASCRYRGRRLSTENSYQYGPICIDKDYRGGQVLPNLFEFSRRQLAARFPILITFINQNNPRSLRAHSKLGLEIVKPFAFNGNNYYQLAYDAAQPTPNHTLIKET